MKLLGVDFGTKNIGLAIGDTETGFAFALRSVGDVAAVVAAAQSEGAQTIVVGMPYRLTGAGSQGETERKVEDFLISLRAATTLLVVTEDERMTTVMVERGRKEAGVKKGKFDKDAAAAAVILETYMTRLGKS